VFDCGELILVHNQRSGVAQHWRPTDRLTDRLTDQPTNQASENLLNPTVTPVKSSPSWRFFSFCVGPSAFAGPHAPLQQEFELTRQLAHLLWQMPEFLRPSFCVSEIALRYASIKLAVQESHRQYNEGRALFVRSSKSKSESDLDCSDSTTTNSSSSERLTGSAASQVYLQHMRTYGLSLTLAAITNAILRAKRVDGGEEEEEEEEEVPETDLHTSYTTGIVALALEAADFEPIGAGFIAPFLDAAWAIDEACRAAIEAVAESHRIGFTVGRARIFSERLRGCLDAVRGSVG